MTGQQYLLKAYKMQDFEISEFEHRLDRAQRLMHQEDLPVMLLTTEPEIRYFTGFRTQFWQSPTRPWYLIIPQTGMPTAIIPEIGFDLMQKCWIDDIRCWPAPRPSDDGIKLLESILLNYTKVGLPMGHETHLQMPLDNFNLLNKNLRINWHDTTPIIRQLRMIKSEAEISLIKRICDIASRSFDKIPEISSVGQPLSELFRSFKIDLLNEGADDIPYLVGGVGEPSYSDVISPPTGRRLSLGETVMLDTGAVYKGYYCDFNRNFAIGEPPSSVKKAYETLWKTTETALDYIRPGVSTSNLFQLMSNTLQTSSSDVGRFGHGLGMQLTEWPSIANWDQTELVKNMVITLEPSIHVDGGGVLVTEENIVVRDGRPELLSKRAFRDIPIIGLP